MSNQHRYETKFILNERKLANLSSWIVSNTKFVRQFPTRINNTLYFDDIKFSSVRDNLIGLAHREKYRLRWYGPSIADNSSIRLETKIRNGRLGSKEVKAVGFVERERTEFTIQEIVKQLTDQVEDQFFSTSGKYLMPSLYVAYEREYFENDEGIRITIDGKIRFADPLNNKCISDLGTLEIKPSVMELKYDFLARSKVASLIRSLNLTPMRNSKYLTGLAMLKKVHYV